MNINSSLEVVSWLLVIVMYALLCITVAGIVDYFFGRQSARWVFYTIGLPLVGVLSIIEGVVRLLIWPWRFREVRLLRETFGIVNMSLDYKESNQAQVKTTLTQLAEEMDAAFRVQEEERSLGQDISYYDWIARCKQRFWNAHALAKRNWFFVHLSYKDYLKK